MDHDGGKSITCFTVGVARCIRQGVQMHGTMYSRGGGGKQGMGAFFYLFFGETALLLTLLRGGGVESAIKKTMMVAATATTPVRVRTVRMYVRTYVRHWGMIPIDA